VPRPSHSGHMPPRYTWLRTTFFSTSPPALPVLNTPLAVDVGTLNENAVGGPT
jgi:hypothetical protein